MRELWGLREESAIARELNRPVQSIRRMAETLFPVQKKSGPWTAREVQDLKRYLGATTVETIALVFGRTVEEIQSQITELGRIQVESEWSRREIAEFKRVYGTRTDEDLAIIFARPLDQVRALAERCSLAKDKAFLRKLHGESATRMPRWSESELDKLRELYPRCANLDIAKELGRSVKSVVSKAHNLGLKKDRERLREMGRENVRLRYEKDDDEDEGTE